MTMTSWVRDPRNRPTVVGVCAGFVVGILGSHTAVSLARLLAPGTGSACDSSGILDCVFDKAIPAVGAVFVFGIYVVLITGVLVLLGGAVLTVALLRLRRSRHIGVGMAATSDACLVSVGVALLVASLSPAVLLAIGTLL